MVELRHSLAKEIPVFLSIQIDPENKEYIGQYSKEEHLEKMNDPNIQYLTVFDINNKIVGFVILAGLKDSNHNIEFRRLVITEKGKGYGKATIEFIKKYAFEKLNAYRLWLDVYDFNERAFYVYQKMGFLEEGRKQESIQGEGKRKTQILMSILRKDFV